MSDNQEYDYEALPDNVPVTTHLIAGALAGITEHTVMHPFDSIKTRMQIINPNPQAVYSGVVQALTRMTTTEGARSLWRGVNSVILGAGPAHALYFATYEHCKSLFGGDAAGHHPIAIGAAGACATIASDALMNPFDVIKQRMQIHGSNYKSIFECAMKVFRAEGFSAFYVSYPTTLTMTIPFQSIQFATYEYFCDTLNPNRTYDPKTHIISGGIAGAFAAAATTPLDVAKTLLQTRGTSTNAEVRNASGMLAAIRIIVKHDGFSGLLRGWKPRVLSHMPATAIAWSTYEYFKWFIKNRNQESLVTAH
ncbi:carrier protein [Basidiobolus meristosporus CBS 931.73]|uniref:Carrier protein n=1 Tax=Basidiobolus meristosporus CBS 931.73 TaxID=1314790 RepID=A0A1Y1YPZ5_9FUNG|nr:carrier protein [Basidiobolus meristosporus CBS 931.73]|eukprot:ORX99644.1 carrier protein [Basidiobolus meristosporus CBS 931.73]